MLSDGSFVTLGLRGLISYYLKHQHSILTKKISMGVRQGRSKT